MIVRVITSELMLKGICTVAIVASFCGMSYGSRLNQELDIVEVDDVRESQNNATMEGKMFRAIKENEVSTVRQIARSNRAVLSKMDNNGNMPLHAAVLQNNYVTVLVLLNEGADPFARNRDGKQPLDLVNDSTLNGIIVILKDAMEQDVAK